MVEDFTNLFCFWYIYSFLGWVCEVIYAKIRNMGYEVRNKTNGPINPGYGFAAVILITLLKSYQSNPLFVFLVGGLIATVLEYITHFLFEKYTGMKLWDYSGRAFNIEGRICLVNSILFGLLCVLMINIVHPYIDDFIINLPLNMKFILNIIFGILYIVEFTIIVVSVYYLKRALQLISDLWNLIKSINPDEISSFREFMSIENEKNKKWYEEKKINIDKISEANDLNLDFENDDYEDEQNILILRLSQIIQDKFLEKNLYQKILYRVLPNLKSVHYEEIFEVMKEENLKK